MKNDTLQIKEDKKIFKKIGYSLFTMILVVSVVQILILTVLDKLAPGIEQNPWYVGLLIGIPFYLVGFPIILLMLKKIPEGPKGEIKKVSFKNMIVVFFISMGATYIFNIVGIFINNLISIIKGSDIINPLEMLTGTSSIIPIIIFVGILSPIVEEIVFRGVLLDKLRAYGDKRAICFTALTFALFHGNLSQFFYALILGLIFGYIAIKTNSIRYNIILHIIVNIFGSVIMPALALSSNKTLVMISGLIVISFVVIGIILFLVNYKKIKFEPTENKIKKVGKKIVYWNIGMVLYYVACIGLLIYVIVV